MINPTWIIAGVAVLTVVINAAMAFKINIYKVKKLKEEMEVLKEESKTMKEKIGNFVAISNCEILQEDCREKLCKKIEDEATRTNGIITDNTRKWQRAATILGAICQKLNIELPRFD